MPFLSCGAINTTKKYLTLWVSGLSYKIYKSFRKSPSPSQLAVSMASASLAPCRAANLSPSSIAVPICSRLKICEEQKIAEMQIGVYPTVEHFLCLVLDAASLIMSSLPYQLSQHLSSSIVKQKRKRNHPTCSAPEGSYPLYLRKKTSMHTCSFSNLGFLLFRISNSRLSFRNCRCYRRLNSSTGLSYLPSVFTY